MSLILQAAPAAQPAAPTAQAPRVASNQSARRASAAAPKAGRPAQGGPGPADLICGYETPVTGPFTYVCRTQAEIDANVKAGAKFSLTRPETPPRPAVVGR